MLQQFIHVTALIGLPVPFYHSIVSHCMDIQHFIDSQAAVNIHVQVFIRTSAFIFLGQTQRTEISGLYGKFMFSF